AGDFRGDKRTGCPQLIDAAGHLPSVAEDRGAFERIDVLIEVPVARDRAGAVEGHVGIEGPNFVCETGIGRPCHTHFLRLEEKTKAALFPVISAGRNGSDFEGATQKQTAKLSPSSS